MSRVTKSAVYPAAFARFRKDRATSTSFGQYSWNQRSASPIASATCSIGVLDAEDSTNGTPCAAAARAAMRLGVRMHDRQHPDRRQGERRGELTAQHLHRQVALMDVPQHARHDPAAVQGGPVGAGGAAVARAAA